MAIIDGLVNKGEFSDTNKSISIRTPKDKLPYITIEVLSEFIEPSAEDIETKSLYKEYSIRDFIDILERLQSKKTVEHPKLSVKYKDATFELIDKLLDL